MGSEMCIRDRVAVSTLRGGQFSSRSLATGETLTNGTYAARDHRTTEDPRG